MSVRRSGISKNQRPEKFCGEGPNWILIAGGALLSTLSIRFGYKLKQSLDWKPQSNGLAGLKGVENTEGKEVTNEQMISSSDTSLPLVTVPPRSFSKENGVMWSSSPDHLELPPKPYNHHSTCSDSPCVSDTSSGIFSKREVIQKLRQQLKRRDDMILEMQEQILEHQKSLNVQIAQSNHLQAELDAMNRDYFDLEREVQRLRKAITDHNVRFIGSNNKSSPVAPWTGLVNGFMEMESNYELPEKGIRDGERIETLRKEVGELKEVIDGNEYLLRSYKEQKMELSQKVIELQQRLDLQLPSIL